MPGEMQTSSDSHRLKGNTPNSTLLLTEAKCRFVVFRNITTGQPVSTTFLYVYN